MPYDPNIAYGPSDKVTFGSQRSGPINDSILRVSNITASGTQSAGTSSYWNLLMTFLMAGSSLCENSMSLYYTPLTLMPG